MLIRLLYLQIQPVWEVLGDDGRSIKLVAIPEETWQTHFHDLPNLQARVVTLEAERTEALQKEVSETDDGEREDGKPRMGSAEDASTG